MNRGNGINGVELIRGWKVTVPGIMHHTRPFAEMTADTEVQLRKKESRMIYNERHGIADVKLSKISTYEKYEKMFPLNIA